MPMNRLAWKRRLGRFRPAPEPGRGRKVVLLYHSLGERAPAVAARRFREQMAWLAGHARVVSLDALLEHPAAGGLQVALTFDDGYASLHDEVAPILSGQGFHAAMYLNTGCVGEAARTPSDAQLGHYPDEHFLAWREVEALAQSGWTIGSHGVAHLDLTRQDAETVARELADSKRDIESRLGRPCRHFAYTWGRFTPALRRAVQDAGYDTAASGLHGPLERGFDRYALPRIDVRAEYELRDFVDAVTGRWDFLGLRQRLARRLE